MNLPPDPISPSGLARYGQDLRSGRTTVVRTVVAYLERIKQLNAQLRAYVHVDAEAALQSARAIDALLASGTDLGPLMGVPVAVKDVLAVSGMPTRVGSDVDVEHLVGEEGGFVKMLRQAGCVLLGKTQTVEFAVGSAGTNYRRGTPRNPRDRDSFRVPGGSSSGSAVAVAAGLCAMAVGTDTGGSVRGPAAFCGIFGMKFGRHAMPDDGMFSMSQSFDSLGLLAPGARDVAIAWNALTGERIPAVDLRRSNLGLPSSYFFDGLAPAMADCVQSGLKALETAGVELVPLDVPALRETDSLYTDIARPEVLATLGSDSFEAMRKRLNPDVAHRISAGLGISAERYLKAQRRRTSLSEVVNATFENLDGWIAPAKQHFPPVYPGEFPSAAMESAMEAHCYGPTRPANLFGLCGCSLPLGRFSERLPAALQVLGPSGREAHILGLAMACEAVLGVSELPDMTDWVG